jgi:hypothetical protein
VKSQRFESSAPLAIGSLTRAEPIRARTMEADAGVLFAQAGITALLLFLWLVVLLLFPVTVPGHWVGEWREWAFSGVLATVKAALLIALLVALALFAWLAYRSERLLWKHEALHAAPEATDSEPQVFTTVIEARVHQDERGPQDFPGLRFKQLRPTRVAFFFDGILAGRTSEAQWAGSVEDFRVVRNELMTHALMYWKNDAHHPSGCGVTAAGRAIMREYLSSLTRAHSDTTDHAKSDARETEGE